MAAHINLEKLLQHKSFLEEIVDPDSGLLDELLRSRTLNRKDFRHIAEEKPYDKRNAKLLEYITDQENCDSFVAALRNTKQGHVVNYLMADGEYRSEYELNWPLTVSQAATLDDNQGVLVDLIDMSELEGRLFSKYVISKKQRNALCSELNQDKKVEMFLEFLRRRSQSDFRATIDCLIKSKQTHVAEILENGGVTVRVHAKTDATEETEREIVETFMRKLGDRSYEQRMRILEQLQFNIIAAKTGGSIVLYVLCRTMKQLEELQIAVNAGQFREYVESLIHKMLLYHKKTNVLNIEVGSEEFASFKECMKKADTRGKSRRNSLNGEVTESPMNSLTTIDLMPLELLDVILQKSYLFSALQESPVRLSDHEIVSQLSCVNLCWSQRLKRRNFKAPVWRSLLGFYRSQKPRDVRYLQNLSLSPIEMNRLKSTDCITDFQAASIQRRRQHLKEKTRLTNQNCALDICNILKSLVGGRYSSFLRSISHTARKGMSKLMEDGGVVAKVELKEWDKTEMTKTKSSLIKRLTDMLNGKSLETALDNRLLDKLRENDLEILDVSLDRDIVCWIWCRSHKGLENLQHFDDRQTFSKIFAELVTVPRGHTFRMNIDYENFKKAMVSFFTCVNLTKRLEFWSTDSYQLEPKLIGITKLGSSIYALCEAPSEIYVFEDQNEFRLLDKIPLKEMNHPMDIGSSQIEKCLYVIDPGDMCVWKIQEETDKAQQKKRRIIKWLETGDDFRPWTLSVSTDGQLLISSFDWSGTLRIYGSDAKLCLSIQSLRGVKKIRHAVKRTNGNIVLIHELWEDSESAGIAEIDKLFHQLKSKYRRPNGKEFESNISKRTESGLEYGGTVRNTDENEGTCWAISELSADGKNIVRLFSPANEDQKLKNPIYLSMDSSDRLFVADTGNDRVILLDSDLKWKQSLIPGVVEITQGRRYFLPYTLFYSEQIYQLVVGRLYANSTCVYTMTTKCKIC